MRIEVGSVVILHLGSPREQVFGILLSMQPSGVAVRGITMSSVDDWLRGLSDESSGFTSGFGLTTTFYPMHRVEKMVLDEGGHGVPAIEERFRRRTGMSLSEHLGLGESA